MNWAAIVWLVLMVLFLIVEAACAIHLVSIWFAVGSLVAMIAAWLGGPVWLQILLFVLVSGALLALSGHKAYYLYGASSNEYRDYLPNHHMQFVMMQYAREKSAKTYDFGGVSVMPEKDSPHFGLWQFKKVWGTEVSEKIGEFDFILRRPIYMAAEIGVPIFQKGKIRMNQMRKGKKE